MKYANIKLCDIANGDGVRVSLFVSGCRNHCKGCFNAEAWDFNYGTEYDGNTEQLIIDNLKPYYIDGLTILGGDPFEPENLPTVTSLCRKVKELYPNKTIWIYTGYKFEDFLSEEIMQYADIVVDGKFIEELKDISLRFRGSSNQRIINVKEFKNENQN